MNLFHVTLQRSLETMVVAVPGGRAVPTPCARATTLSMPAKVCPATELLNRTDREDPALCNRVL